jgi:hypothetical protein
MSNVTALTGGSPIRKGQSKDDGKSSGAIATCTRLGVFREWMLAVLLVERESSPLDDDMASKLPVASSGKRKGAV